MVKKADCVFCQMQSGLVPFHQVWENENHFSFLSIFPNTPGFTVVATKEHYESYAFDQTEAVLAGLVIATQKVAKILDHYFDDVSRCGMFFEGFGVDHLHSKLFPMHGTGKLERWKAIESESNSTFYEKYPGFLSSNNSARADESELATLAAGIRNSVRK